MSRYFQRELPAAFPPLPLEIERPVENSHRQRRWSSLLRSRIVLAISVAAVSLGCWLVLSRRGDSLNRPSTNLDSGSAVKKDGLGKK